MENQKESDQLTDQQIASEYFRTYKQSNRIAAEQYLSDYFAKNTNLSANEKRRIGNLAREAIYQEQRDKQAKVEKKKASAAEKLSHMINVVPNAILSSGKSLKDNEKKFLESIPDQRGLSTKQKQWLKLIADRVGVEMEYSPRTNALKNKGPSKGAPDYVYSESKAYELFDLPTYDPENKRWYDAEY